MCTLRARSQQHSFNLSNSKINKIGLNCMTSLIWQQSKEQFRLRDVYAPTESQLRTHVEQ